MEVEAERGGCRGRFEEEGGVEEAAREGGGGGGGRGTASFDLVEVGYHLSGGGGGGSGGVGTWPTAAAGLLAAVHVLNDDGVNMILPANSGPGV